MGRLNYIIGVSAIGLTGAMVAAPAYASSNDAASTPIAMEARGTFRGFRIDSAPIEAAIPSQSILPDLPAPQYQAVPRNRVVRRNLDAVPVPALPEIISRDDVGLEGSVDVNNTQPSVVQLFSQRNSDGGVFFNCTGTVINPRTILTAAHCLNARSSEAYGTPESGAERTVLISTGVDTRTRFFDYLNNGNSYSQGGVASSTDVIIHPSSNLDNGALPFPWADVALIALDEPILDVPALPILLSPLTELTHVVQVGYGGFGTAATGDIGIGFLRRVGENMLGAVASPADLFDAAFPTFAPSAVVLEAESQAFYFTDFDNPFRTPEEEAGCVFPGNTISCDSLEAVLAIDWFDGDALPNEVATAGGDSGSPLIADQLGGPAVVTAVLSGGFDFFGVGNTYGDISFYNPLYPFFEFITQNTPYKYVSAKTGSGVWSDPRHWTQDLDPGFLIDDGTGNLVNGIPTGSEPGVYETGPKLGNILGQDISGNADLDTVILPPEGTPNFGANIPESSVLLGPGSTGFVPQNTDGTPGTAFAAPAQYFDVFLNRVGRTRVDMNVEIDKLTLDNPFASLRLPDQYSFTTIIGYEQFSGVSEIDGALNAGLVGLFGGIFEGTGTVTTEAFFNIGGAVVPGSLFKTGTLAIDGAYVQTSQGTLLTNANFNRRGNTSDLLSITGDASLAGKLIVAASGRPRFGDEVTVVSANSVLGGFDETLLVTLSPLLFGKSRVEGGDVIVTVDALRFRDLLSNFASLRSLGETLDTLRFGGKFAQFSGLFDIVDGADINSLASTLSSLTPVSAFNQSTIATNFSQRFTGQLSQRTLSLRGANKAAAGFSTAGNAAFAIAGTNPQEAGQIGFFSTVSGVFLANATDRNTGANAFEESVFLQGGEMTLGADLRMSDTFSVGIAVTSIRNSTPSIGITTRPEDTSVAAAAYGAAQFGQGFADMYLGFSRQNLTSNSASLGQTAIPFRIAQGAADGRQAFAGVRAGYAFGVVPGLEFGPVVSMDYVRSNIGGFDEFGAGDFGLTVNARNFTSLGTKLGVMGALDTRIGRTGKLTAFGSVAYAYELADRQDVVTASFFGASEAPFSIANALDPQWVSVNAGAELALANRTSIGITATSDLGRGVLTNNQGNVTLRWRF